MKDHARSPERMFPLVNALFGRFSWLEIGGQGRRRSVDLRFFRPALYRLSYLTMRVP